MTAQTNKPQNAIEPDVPAPPRPGTVRVPFEKVGVPLDGSGRTAPWRWLLVLVPLVLIAVAGASLIGPLGASLQHLLRQAQSMTERSEESDPQLSAARPETVPQPESAPDHKPPLIKELLERLGKQSEDSAGRTPTVEDMAPIDWDKMFPKRVDAEPDARPPLDVAAVAQMLPRASLADGAATFKMCSACHTSEKGGQTKIGPNLWGVAGRPKASLPNFRYSEALKKKGGIWTVEELAAYLHNPRSAVPGTSMSFAGILDARRLASLIAYLDTLSDTPGPPGR